MRVRLQLWTKEQGGRHTPCFDGYRPDFRAGTEGHGDVDLGAATLALPPDEPMMMPGTEAEVELTPSDSSLWSAVGNDLVLGVFESDRQVGTATVL